MPLTAAQLAYRSNPAEREKRRLYALQQRQRPDVQARDRERKRRERSTEAGAQLNRDRVKRDRQRLGRHYFAKLIGESIGVRSREVSVALVDMKREQILLKRMADELLTKATQQRRKT